MRFVLQRKKGVVVVVVVIVVFDWRIRCVLFFNGKKALWLWVVFVVCDSSTTPRPRPRPPPPPRSVLGPAGQSLQRLSLEKKITESER